MSLTLYHIAPSRSSTVLWLLEELGEPYEVAQLNMARGDNHEAAYLAINPLGKVPAIDHDGTIVTEVGAVCLYLADAFPQAGLTVPVGDAGRGRFLRWMFFHHGSFEPAMMDRAFRRAEEAPPSALPQGSYDAVLDVVARAVAAGPYLMGERFTAADVLLGSGVRWGLAFGLLPKRDEFAAYAERLAARPAARRAEAKDAEMAALNAAGSQA